MVTYCFRNSWLYERRHRPVPWAEAVRASDGSTTAAAEGREDWQSLNWSDLGAALRRLLSTLLRRTGCWLGRAGRENGREYNAWLEMVLTEDINKLSFCSFATHAVKARAREPINQSFILQVNVWRHQVRLGQLDKIKTKKPIDRLEPTADKLFVRDLFLWESHL